MSNEVATNDEKVISVTPVSSSTLKHNKRNQSPKATASNITDIKTKAAKSTKVTKAAKPKAEKPAKAAKVVKVVKEKKISKTLTATPVLDLKNVQFVPNWVTANLPEHIQEFNPQKFSFLGVYLTVRELAAKDGKLYHRLTVGELIDLLTKWANGDGKGSIIGLRIASLDALGMRDLKARLQWLMFLTLERYDSQIRYKMDEAEAARKAEDNVK